MSYTFKPQELCLGNEIRLNDKPREGSIVRVNASMLTILESDPEKFSQIYEPILLTEALMQNVTADSAFMLPELLMKIYHTIKLQPENKNASFHELQNAMYVITKISISLLNSNPKQ